MSRRCETTDSEGDNIFALRKGFRYILDNGDINDIKNGGIPKSHIDCFAGRIPETWSWSQEGSDVAPVHLLNVATHNFHVAHAAAVCKNYDALRAILSRDQLFEENMKLLHNVSAFSLGHALALGRCPALIFREFLSDHRSQHLLQTTSEGISVLHCAAYGGSVDTMQFVLSMGAKLSDKRNDGYTVLMAAAEGGDVEAIRFLLSQQKKEGARIDEKMNNGSTVLMCAAFAGNTEAIKLLLMSGSKITERKLNGGTVLMAAAEGGSIEAMECLLSNGSHIDEKRSNGYTVLMAAAEGGNFEAVKFLLSRGANFGEKTTAGYTACMFAAIGGIKDAFEMIVEMQLLLSMGYQSEEERAK